MTHPPVPPAPPGGTPDDARDPRVAASLEVAPLDDVTRTRLVRAALDRSTEREREQPAPRRWRDARVAAVAAALLVFLVGGIAVLAPRSEQSGPTAADTPSRSTLDAEPDAGSTSDAAPGPLASESAPVALRSVGALGDVSTAAALRGALSGRSPSSDTVLVPAPCALDLARRSGEPVSAGSGSAGGEPVTVIVVAGRAGETTALAVSDASCTLVVRARL